MPDELSTGEGWHLTLRDTIAQRSLETIREEVVKGSHWTVPWLDLDAEAYRAYRERRTDKLPEPHCDDPVDRIMMADVQGKEVLCLAGSAGQPGTSRRASWPPSRVARRGPSSAMADRLPLMGACSNSLPSGAR